MCHPSRLHSSDNICIVPVQSRRPLRPSPFTGALQERSDARRRERRRGPRVNPFIYLFMCHGGARADEGVRGAAYSRRMHRTGNPTGATVRDEGNGKSHGELARGYSTPSPGLSRRLFRNIRGVYVFARLIRRMMISGMNSSLIKLAFK